MSGAPDPYADIASPTSGDDPYAAIATPVSAQPASPQPGEAAYKQRKAYGHRAGRWLDAGVRGAADFASFGFGDEIAAGLNSLPALMPGGESYGDAYKRNVADERAIDQADREDLPVTRGVGEGLGFLGTLAGTAVAAPVRAAAPAARGLAGAGVNLLRSAGAGAAYSGVAAAGNAEGNVLDRTEAALPAAAIGAGLGAAAVPVAHVVGEGVNALTTRFAPEIDRAANALSRRYDVNLLRARADDLRAAGADPTAASALDESGRGFVRAAASRNTPARELVQQRADASALNLPDRIGMQAREHISATPRGADTVVNALDEARSAEARTTYADPYAQRVQITPGVSSALSGREGQSAIDAAIATAEGRRDYAVIADLRALQKAAKSGLPQPLETLGVKTDPPTIPQVSGAALDRVQQELGRRSRNLTRSIEDPNNALAAGLSGRQRDVNAALDAIDGLKPAREAFKGATRNMDAADAASAFLQPDAEQAFGDAMGSASDLQPARDVAARAVIRAAGENVSAAPSVARKLAYAPEQQARNAQLLGQDGADRFQASMAAEARTNRDLQDVAPRTGSQTQVRTADQEAAGNVVGAIQTVAGGPRAWAAAAINRLKTAGLSDHDAQAVASVATDPRQLDDLLGRMERMRPGSGQWLRTVLNEAADPNVGEATQPPAQVNALRP